MSVNSVWSSGLDIDSKKTHIVVDFLNVIFNPVSNKLTFSKISYQVALEKSGGYLNVNANDFIRWWNMFVIWVNWPFKFLLNEEALLVLSLFQTSWSSYYQVNLKSYFIPHSNITRLLCAKRNHSLYSEFLIFCFIYSVSHAPYKSPVWLHTWTTAATALIFHRLQTLMLTLTCKDRNSMHNASEWDTLCSNIAL